MYGLRTSGKRHGDVYTLSTVVRYMLDILGYTADADLSRISILEPSCGEGAFVEEIIARLQQSSKKYGFDLEMAINRNVSCFDIDKTKLTICESKVRAIVPTIRLADTVFRSEDFLLAKIDSVDMIVGNPPYVRHEQIPQLLKELYRKEFVSFRYRADLYIPFFEKSLRNLNPRGKHAFICSNRWLKNQYGYDLRNIISREFNLEAIVNLEKVNPFQEEVVAYPAITLISKTKPSAESFHYTDVEDISLLGKTASKRYAHPTNGDWSDTFNIAVSRLKLVSIEELGFKVGIGVATGADQVFIGKDLIHEVEREVLLPIITSKDVKSNELKWSGNYLFNPFDENGEIIDLSRYPKAYAYLQAHREKLEKRYISRKNPSHWYRTIDRVYPDIQFSPKILLPDISGNSHLLIDEGEYYPHHNLYYITGGDLRGLKLLCAILMSDFALNQLISLSNSMNGGYPRWQSQYVKRLKLPDLNQLTLSHCNELIGMYDSRNIAGINTLVASVVI